MVILSRLCKRLRKDGVKATMQLAWGTIAERLYLHIMGRIKTLPLRNTIILECENDMDDNPRAIYEYMLAQKMNRKYKIVWIVRDIKFCKKTYKNHRVRFLSRYDQSYKNQIRLEYHLSTARWLVFSHPYWFRKRNASQLVINVAHGIPLKNAGKDPNIAKTFDMLLVTTKHVEDWFLRFWRCEAEKVFFCGNPRNDFLRNGNRAVLFSKLFTWEPDEKVIMCMPTYRRSVNQTDCSVADPYSLGVIQTKEEFDQLNSFLVQEKIHIIVKPHPLQVASDLCANRASNIHYIFNAELLQKQILLYELLGCCDALITDFSSVFFDYLILDKPIAFFMADFAQYTRGYIVSNPVDYMPGEKVYSYDDLIKFIQSVVQKTDKYSSERRGINSIVNGNGDSDNCARFVELLFGGHIHPAGLKKGRDNDP